MLFRSGRGTAPAGREKSASRAFRNHPYKKPRTLTTPPCGTLRQKKMPRRFASVHLDFPKCAAEPCLCDRTISATAPAARENSQVIDAYKRNIAFHTCTAQPHNAQEHEGFTVLVAGVLDDQRSDSARP